MSHTDEGIFIEASELQLENVDSLIKVTASGILIEVNPQP